VSPNLRLLHVRPEAELTVVEHRGGEAIETATSAWLAVIARSPAVTPFSTPAWASTWFSVYGDGHLPLVLEVRADGVPVAIAPLQRTRYPGARARRLEFISTAPMTPSQWALNPRHRGQAIYADTIIVPGFEATALTALRRWLSQRIGLWDELRLYCVPSSSPLGKGFDDFARSWSPHVQLDERVYVDTSEGWSAYRGRLSKRQVRHLRYEPNTLARKAGGELELVAYRAGDVRAGIEMFSDMYYARWAAKGRGMPTKNRLLYRRLASRTELHPIVYSLVAGGRTLAMQFGFDNGRRYIPYGFAFDPSIDQTSPANVLIQFLIRRCCDDDHDEIDLAALDVVDRWAGESRPRVTLTAISPRFPARARVRSLEAIELALTAFHKSKSGRRVIGTLGRIRRSTSGTLP